MASEEDAPTSSMRGILAVAEQVHHKELDQREAQIRDLQMENLKLNDEYKNLHHKYSELRRSSIEEKGHVISANQNYEQRIASLELQIRGLECEIGRLKQEHSAEVSHLKTEHDKANHIIKNLLTKVRHSSTP